jgi:hypothetical protein
MPKIKYKLIDPDEKFQKNPHKNAPSPQHIPAVENTPRKIHLSPHPRT